MCLSAPKEERAEQFCRAFPSTKIPNIHNTFSPLGTYNVREKQKYKANGYELVANYARPIS